ncbi:hypothetical protein H072_2286 [Dactylellina haptotyla CBS 200.50]|uniref:Uncharacterized protein n=1 Tax=Dactylellina haptotyla (strain CBS 200.50) TaxID=1284197 RepID=S8BW31_DACHA|nr:hypothetical protein H072_2286 [Dactylellina haptotyla CBS 200.50]
MSNYNPDYRRDTKESPPYSRDVSPERQARGDPSSSLQLPAEKPAQPMGLTVSPPSSQTAYAAYNPGASPSSSPVNTKTTPASPKGGDKGAYKAYRPPVQQAYSTDSVIPNQPHGPYTAYQPPKPVTSTQLPNVAPPRPQPSPMISPLIQPTGQTDPRPISPPAQRLPSPLPTGFPANNNEPYHHNSNAQALPSSQAGSSAAYYAPSVTDSIASTPSIYEKPNIFSGQPISHSPPVASGPFTSQGGAYQQQPQQFPGYIPLQPTNSLPYAQQEAPNYAPPIPGGPAAAAPTPFSPQQQTPPLATGYADSNYHPFTPPVQPQQEAMYTPTTQQTIITPSSQGQAYAVELPTSPGLPNIPPKPQKQLSFTLPPSDVYAERIANFMNMLEKEASLAPTAAPTPGMPEPEDLETRRHKVFRAWIVSEAKLRGPKFATDLADDLDSLSFGNKRASEQFTTKPRGSVDVYSGTTSQSRDIPFSQGGYPNPLQPTVTNIDISKLLPLIYPPPPPKVTPAARLAPFQKTFTSISNLSFIEKNRQSFAANQSNIERRIQNEIDEVRRRRGKRNPADAENLVREIRKREGLDAYERFDREVVTATYGELMKAGEVIDTIKQGVEDLVRDGVNTLSATELLEIFSFLTAVQDLSTTIHNHMESLLTERSMKYMYSLTVPLYEANDAAEAKKIEAWNQSVVAGQVADNKTAEEKRVAKYSKFIVETSDQVIAREKDKTARLTAALTELVRAVDGGLRNGGRIEFSIPQGEDIRPYDLSEGGKLLWLRSKILVAAIAIQASMESQKALQKTKDVAARLAIKARYAAQEAEAVKQHPTNQQKNIEDINKLREQQVREVEQLNKTEERGSESRGIERGRFEAIVRPTADTLKGQAVVIGGERVQSWTKDSSQEAILGWV